MKIAKLEIKVIIALFLAGYEYDVVDSEGNLTEHVPEPDHNDMHRVRFETLLFPDCSPLIQWLRWNREDQSGSLLICSSDVSSTKAFLWCNLYPV